MRLRVVSFADTGRRGSLHPADFIYKPGREVLVLGRDGQYRRAIVTAQTADTVLVSTVNFVPGSRTPFSCERPRPVDISLIKVGS